MAENDFIALAFERMAAEESIEASELFYTTMRKRRSVRNFSTDPISMQAIQNALLTAGSAPSGANKQPWHFAVVTDPNIKRDIRLAAEAEEREFYQRRASKAWLDDLQPLGTNDQKPFLENAPCLIGIFLKKFSSTDNNDKSKNYYTSESVGIATGMLISALHIAGFATLTHTPSPMKFLNRILKRPSDERAFLLLIVGYPALGATVPNISKLPLDDISSFFPADEHLGS
ncbi:MAG: iodotyrosine deiodinase [Oceanicoccus sp.]|jgi:iodotyrosine deiodinase